MPNPLVSESTQILQLLTHIQPTEELENLFTTLQEQLQQKPEPAASLKAMLELRDTWKQIREKASDLFEVAELLYCLDGYFVALDRRLWLHRKDVDAGDMEGKQSVRRGIGPGKPFPVQGRGTGKAVSARGGETSVARLRLLPFGDGKEAALPAGQRLDAGEGKVPCEKGERHPQDRLLTKPGSKQEGGTAVTPPLTDCKPVAAKAPEVSRCPEGVGQEGYVLLPEQQWVVDDPLRESLLISAVAGAGKTTTLVHSARGRTKQSILYLCFDNAMARKAETVFPRYVRVSTLHALAWRECGFHYRHKLVEGRELGTGTLREWLAGSPDFNRLSRDTQYSLVGLLYEVIRRFLQTPEKQWREVRPSDLATATTQRMWSAMNQHGLRLLRDFFVQWWQQAQDPQSRVPISHDVYFKVWVSRCPRLMADIVMLDEAQDTNPLGIALLEGQQIPKVIIGDPHQSIYGWRGARNALSAFEHYRQHRLSTSFRFGNEVGRLAMEVLRLKGVKVTVRGNGPETQILPPGELKMGQTIICRTQAGVLDAMSQCITRKLSFRLPPALGEYLLREIQPLYHFWRTGQSEHEKYRLFHSWDEYVRCAENLGDREGIARIRLVEKRQGELARIMETLRLGPEPAPTTAPSGVTITTAHRAKGQEFDEVHIWNDFVNPLEEPSPEDEEINLLYMAVTRARHRLFLNAATWEWWQTRRRMVTYLTD